MYPVTVAELLAKCTITSENFFYRNIRELSAINAVIFVTLFFIKINHKKVVIEHAAGRKQKDKALLASVNLVLN